MFLQLVAGGHLLLFVTRQTRWFFQKPYPTKALFWAIVITQIFAACACYFGWLVPRILLWMICEVWIYNIAWMFVLNIIRILIEKAWLTASETCFFKAAFSSSVKFEASIASSLGLAA